MTTNMATLFKVFKSVRFVLAVWILISILPSSKQVSLCGPSMPSPCSDSHTNMAVFMVDRPMPCSGYIVRWEFCTKAASTMDINIWRPKVGGTATEFELVGKNELTYTFAGNHVFNVPLADQIHCEAGDVMTASLDGGTVPMHVCKTYGGTQQVYKKTSWGVDGKNIGDSIDIATWTTGNEHQCIRPVISNTLADTQISPPGSAEGGALLQSLTDGTCATLNATTLPQGVVLKMIWPEVFTRVTITLTGSNLYCDRNAPSADVCLPIMVITGGNNTAVGMANRGISVDVVCAGLNYGSTCSFDCVCSLSEGCMSTMLMLSPENIYNAGETQLCAIRFEYGTAV